MLGICFALKESDGGPLSCRGGSMILFGGQLLLLLLPRRQMAFPSGFRSM